MCVELANYYFTGEKVGNFRIISLMNLSFSETNLIPKQGITNPLTLILHQKITSIRFTWDHILVQAESANFRQQQVGQY